MPVDISKLTLEQLLVLLRSRALSGAPPVSPWMTPQEAAGYLSISLGTLRNWTSARFLPFSKKGRVVRYSRTAIDEWLAKGGCAGRRTLAEVAN